MVEDLSVGMASNVRKRCRSTGKGSEEVRCLGVRGEHWKESADRRKIGDGRRGVMGSSHVCLEFGL